MESLIAIFMAAVCLSGATNINRHPDSSNLLATELPKKLKCYSRFDWSARTPAQTTPLQTPVPYVVIHHSHSPPACNTSVECFKAMRSMQNFHIDDRGWWDIGYNFAVGSDGAVYEGRGWRALGAHALHFNTVSIGICIIGDWSEKLPPKRQLEAAKSLIESGVSRGHIQPGYKLVGHRQVRETQCPGVALFDEIKKWPQYSDFPASVAQLDQVAELPYSVKELLSNRIVTN